MRLPNSPMPFRGWLGSFLEVSGLAMVGLNAFVVDSFKPCCPQPAMHSLDPIQADRCGPVPHLGEAAGAGCRNLSSPMIYFGLL